MWWVYVCLYVCVFVDGSICMCSVRLMVLYVCVVLGLVVVREEEKVVIVIMMMIQILIFGFNPNSLFLNFLFLQISV